MKKKLLNFLGALSLAVTAAVVAVPAQPAYAVDANFCNSSGSVEMVSLYRDIYFIRDVYPGQCFDVNPIEGVIVDTDPAGNVDVDSYRIRTNGVWGKCHVGENHDSNPTNAGDLVYKNYKTNDCNGLI